eukprot:scaffold10770_cov90-Isochrysis_galbana.AAC.2
MRRRPRPGGRKASAACGGRQTGRGAHHLTPSEGVQGGAWVAGKQGGSGGRARVTRTGGLGGPMERQGDGARPGGRWAVDREYCKELKASRWAPARIKMIGRTPTPRPGPAPCGDRPRPKQTPRNPSDTP